MFFGGGAYGSLPNAAIWWCLRTGGGGVVTRVSVYIIEATWIDFTLASVELLFRVLGHNIICVPVVRGITQNFKHVYLHNYIWSTLKGRLTILTTTYKMYCTLRYFTTPPFCLCFTTHITISADHGGRRLQPIPSPVARWRPSRVRRYHPHTMGDDAYAQLCVISSGARAVIPPPQRHICRLVFFGKKILHNTMNMHL
jgi:hypothetical protein